MLLIGVLPLGVHVIDWAATSGRPCYLLECYLWVFMLLIGLLPLGVHVINWAATSGRPCY